MITIPSKTGVLRLTFDNELWPRVCFGVKQADTDSITTGRDMMQLSVDEQWIMAYMNTRIHNWGDVRDEAIRSMKRIHEHQDFIDWIECFLPAARQDELKRALSAFKAAKAKQNQPAPTVRQVPVKLDERVVKLLLDKAKAENCSVSELLIRRLAS